MIAIFWLVVLGIASRTLASRLVVYNFESGVESGLLIPVNSSKALNSGFTICFRMNFRSWNDQLIFDSENQLDLFIYHYNCNVGGTMTFGPIANNFDAFHQIESFNKWQPFCLTYNAQSYYAKLFGNGIKLLNERVIVDTKGGPLNFGNWLQFGMDLQYQLLGSLTDLNIWSR